MTHTHCVLLLSFATINQSINQSKRKTSYANGETNLGHKHKAPDHNPNPKPRAMLAISVLVQIRQFQPSMVAIRDPAKVSELKELIKDVPKQPEILVGDEGAVEVRGGRGGGGRGPAGRGVGC